MKKGEGALEIVLVAALDERGVIGVDGDLPWRLPADLKHFQRVTMGYPVIMGRRTFESLGGPLAGRPTIVLTGQEGYEAPGAEVVASMEQALRAGEKREADKVMILGGGGVYEQFLPRAERMFLTVVHDRYEGDTFFPRFEGKQWEVVSRRFRAADEKNESAMSFVELRAVVDEPRWVRARRVASELCDLLRFDGDIDDVGK